MANERAVKDLTEKNKKYAAGRSIGLHDLCRNGRNWMESNCATLLAAKNDDPAWLQGYCDSLDLGCQHEYLIGVSGDSSYCRFCGES